MPRFTIQQTNVLYETEFGDIGASYDDSNLDMSEMYPNLEFNKLAEYIATLIEIYLDMNKDKPNQKQQLIAIIDGAIGAITEPKVYRE